MGYNGVFYKKYIYILNDNIFIISLNIRIKIRLYIEKINFLL